MTNSQIFKAAHAEAKVILATRRGPVISYAEAFQFGLRRIYNKIAQDRFVAAVMTQPQKPKFMWLRGM